MSEDVTISRKNNLDFKLLKSFATDEDRCDSAELPVKLTDIARNCEEVAKKLKKRSTAKHGKGQGSSNKERTGVQSGDTRISEFEKVADLLISENDKLSKEIDRKADDINGKDIENEDGGESISSLKAENIKLRQVCKEITGINKRWQKYNKEIYSYIKRLEDALQNKITENVSATESTSQKRRGVNSGLPEGKLPLLTRYDDLLKDSCQLQKELEASRQTEEVLKEQIELLREESEETIKLLNCQLSIYKEDYEAEKREKMVSRSTSMQLSKELEHARAQLRECQKRLKEVKEISRPPGTKSPTTSTNPFVFNMIEREGHSSRRNRYLRSDGSSEIPETPECSKAAAGNRDEASEKNDSYECPDCGMVFPSEKSEEYLEHFEKCQRN